MQKEKLKRARLDKGFTQQQCADAIPTDVSNYCRKENGFTGITRKEWGKLAALLQMNVEDIYEEDEKVSITYENTTFGENAGNLFSNYQGIPDSIIKNLQDYIELLKEENANLKVENARLKKKLKIK